LAFAAEKWLLELLSPADKSRPQICKFALVMEILLVECKVSWPTVKEHRAQEAL
jgi:hypothetical protein